MKRRFKLAAVTALTVSMTAFSTVPVEACNRGGGGSRRAFRAHTPFATSHRAYQPRYQQQAYRAQPAYRHAQPVIAQPQPVVRTQPVVQTQPAVQQVVQAPATTAQTQQAVQAAPVQQTAGQPTSVQPTSVQRTATPQTTTTQPATQSGSSEATALQLLESLSDDTNNTESNSQIPEFGAASPNPAGNHVGTWKVNLPGNQSVELSLNENGTFRWTATKNGKSSAFEGQYRLETGRLTLVRSTDLQQMTGSWTANGEKFTFKLDGAKAGGLAFARS